MFHRSFCIMWNVNIQIRSGIQLKFDIGRIQVKRLKVAELNIFTKRQTINCLEYNGRYTQNKNKPYKCGKFCQENRIYPVIVKLLEDKQRYCKRRAKISADISACLFGITCYKVSGIPIHKNIIVDIKSWTQHLLLCHLCPPSGLLPHLVSFYPTWRILPQF